MYTQDNPYRIFSSGGGRQSVAVLVLQAQGRLTNPYHEHVFCNVGHDSENPLTIQYLNDYVLPFAEKHGIPFHVIVKTDRQGNPSPTLYESMMKDERSIRIPIRLPKGKGFGNRSCTVNYKIRVVDKYIRQHGYGYCEIGLGISWDESTRARGTHWTDVESETAAKPRPLRFWKRRRYDLIDLRMTAQDCVRVVQEAGFPEPPKSSCYFCPFHSADAWRTLSVQQPELFAKAVEIEIEMNRKRLNIGRDGVFLHPNLISLDRAVGEHMPLPGFEVDSCESGYCMT